MIYAVLQHLIKNARICVTVQAFNKYRITEYYLPNFFFKFSSIAAKNSSVYK